MKRGQPLRRTPLARGVTKLRRTGPLRAVSSTRQAANRVRARAVKVLRQAGDWCAGCGATGVITDGHEKRARSQGGDITRPDLLLCRPCNTEVEDRPIEAAWNGWKSSRKHPTAPCIADGRCPIGAHPVVGDSCEDVAA